MAALRLHLAAHGFAVGHLRGLEQDFHLVAALGPLHGGFDVQLAHAGKQDVAGFLVAAQLQRRVLVKQLLDGGVDLIFFALFLGGKGEGDELRGQLRHGDGEGRLVVAEGVARAGVLQLAHGYDGAGAENVLAGRLGFTVKVEQGAEAFGLFRAHVLEGGVGADGAGNHAHHVELAGEGVRDGLEDEAAGRALVVRNAFVALGVEVGGAFERGREEADDGVEKLGAALVFKGRAHHNRGQAAVEHALAQARGKVLGGEGAFLKVFFHQFFVGFGDVLDGRIAQQGGFVHERLGDERVAHGPVVPEHERLAAEDVHQPREGFAVADGHVQRNRLHAEHGGKAVVGHVEIGAVTVHLIDEDDGGKPGVARGVPDAAGQGAHAVHGVDDHDGGVHAHEQVGEIAREVGIAGNVHEEMAVFVPEESGETGLDGAAALDFFRFVIESGRAFFNGSQTVDDAALEEQHFRQ